MEFPVLQDIQGFNMPFIFWFLHRQLFVSKKVESRRSLFTISPYPLFVHQISFGTGWKKHYGVLKSKCH